MHRALTSEMALDTPVREAVTVSVAVTVWLPAVFRVTGKVPVPLVEVESPGVPPGHPCS